MIFPAYPPGPAKTFLPGGGPITDEAVPLLAGGFVITVDVEVPRVDPRGVLFALGDWNGGYALYVVDGRPQFTFARADEPVTVTADSALPAGAHRIVVAYTPDLSGEGAFTLSLDGAAAGTARFRGGLPFVLQHGGTALRLGSDRGFPVSDAYTPPFPWNGTLHRVVFETPGVRPADVADVRAALHAD
jgi:hypothetical protein